MNEKELEEIIKEAEKERKEKERKLLEIRKRLDKLTQTR